MRTTEKNFSLEGGLKALAEPTRLTILSLLAKYGDLCVAQLVEALKLPQAGVSQHLRVLKYQGLVNVSKSGQWSYYSMIPERISSIASNLQSIPKGIYNIPDQVCKIVECSMLPHPKNDKIINADFDT
jgi:ArsR family transcriptional regulator